MTQPSNTFDENKNWLWTNQQEHVSLEADKLNIDSQIASLLTRRAICELIGNGSPNDGFLIDDTEEANPAIGVGDLYVCGMKLEQPDEITYNIQPNFLETTLKTLGDGLYYLDIAEEQIDEIIDPDIVDPAIGYPTVLPKRAKWILKWVEDTATMPDPAATHYHMLVAIKSGGLLVDQRNVGIVIAGVDTGFQEREGGGLDEGTFSQSCTQVLTVSKTGTTPYTTIQDAIDYAAAQTPTYENRWIVMVCPGEYDEPLIVGVNYVSIVGIGGTQKDGARILGRYVAPDIESCVQNIMFTRNVIPGNSEGIITAGKGSHDFINCKFQLISTNLGGSVVSVGNTGDGSYTFQDCDFELNATGAMGSLRTHSILECITSYYTARIRVTGCNIDFTLNDDNDYYFLFLFDGVGPKDYVIDNNVIKVYSLGSDGIYERVILWTTSPGTEGLVGQEFPTFSNNIITVTHETGATPVGTNVYHYWVGTTGVLLAQNNDWNQSFGHSVYCDGTIYIYGDIGLEFETFGTGNIYGSYICNPEGAYNHISQLDIMGKGAVGVDQVIPLIGIQQIIEFNTQIFDSPSDWFNPATYEWTIRREGYISVQGKIQITTTISPEATEEVLVEILKNEISVDNYAYTIVNTNDAIDFVTKFICSINFIGQMDKGDVITIAITVLNASLEVSNNLSVIGDGTGLETVVTVQKIA